jgi:hypothetical protein
LQKFARNLSAGTGRERSQFIQRFLSGKLRDWRSLGRRRTRTQFPYPASVSRSPVNWR